MWNDRTSAIGVFDSGLGGLTVLRSCLSDMPGEDFIYLGDTARTPYGSKGADTIRRYANECAHFLESEKVKLIIVACNTVSTHALSMLVEQCRCPVIGTVEPAVVRALEYTKNERVGVIGTEATTASRVYETTIKSFRPTASVHSVACPLFVPLVEQGMFEGEIVERIVELYLAPLREAEIDTLILGCTHYPLLSDAIQGYLGDQTTLIACSDAVSHTASQILAKRELEHLRGSGGATRYYVTDAVQRFNRLGAALLNLDEIQAKQIEIPFQK